ncbi:thiamine-phosphate pyrophosphorylase [Dietzia sp. UCD-THP]|uniref:thiamine phosphate synthase n=1 Tax=Dietzia sp. UCD-THP TaxID=1292020 RepID=UPI00037987AD|nr:thiamine phosphate synthase [Dietzia sp. UCD-THP]EYT62717.1 thiamine-phosphate pyrophosphorylase [Dietzia sp. UCD-THP]
MTHPTSGARATTPSGHARSAAAVDWRVYLVTDPHLGGDRDAVPGIVHQAVLGGVGVVQVRDKECDDDEFATRAASVADAARRAGARVGREVPVFVNDRLEVARELGLHLHVGQRDVAFGRARAELPEHLMLGLSIESDEQLHVALGGPGPVPDVIGVSPVWSTATKTDTAAALGPSAADRLARVARRRGVAAVGIGGITPANVDLLAGTALDGVCVVSAVMGASDPRAAALDLLSRWDRSRARG